MKKLISILLVVVMLVAMVPAMAFTTSAATTTPSGKWTDAGNYDLSWASGLITATEKSGESVTVGGKIYTIKYHTATYIIDTPEKLAGVAVLANAGNIESFSGTVFKITTEIDLGAHYWESIANTTAKKFRGLITAETEGVIKNMTIFDTANDASKCYGLVGAQGSGQNDTGAIRNITLQNASINVKNGYVGSFVGYTNYAANEYRNIKSDAKIVCSSGIDSATGKYVEHGNAYNYVGGIVGRIGNDGSAEVFTGCIFTGSIDAPTATVVGGIVGGDRRVDGTKLTLNKCVVAAEFIRYGAYRVGGHNSWYAGCAGIIGVCLYGDLTLNECYVSIGEYTFYAEQNAPTSAHEGVGGMVGNSDSVGTHTLSNCQVDMAIGNTDTATHLATFLGRHFAPATFTGCVNTGMFARIKGAGWNGANTFAWSARNPGITDGGKNFASFSQRYGWDYTASAPTVIESVDTWKNTLDSSVWSERAGSIYPILTIAKDYDKYSVSGANIDYSFFNISGCKVTTPAEFNALNNILNAMVSYADETINQKVTISPALATADMTGFSANSKNLINAKLGVANKIDDGAIFDIENTDGNDDAVFAQVSLTKNENNLYDIRFVITVNDISACDGVKFDVAASRGDKFGGFLESDVVTKCYRTVVEITADGEVEHTAEGDAYYVICVVNNVDLSAETTFTVRANAVTVDGEAVTLVAQSAAVNFVVPAAN